LVAAAQTRSAAVVVALAFGLISGACSSDSASRSGTGGSAGGAAGGKGGNSGGAGRGGAGASGGAAGTGGVAGTSGAAGASGGAAGRGGAVAGSGGSAAGAGGAAAGRGGAVAGSGGGAGVSGRGGGAAGAGGNAAGGTGGTGGRACEMNECLRAFVCRRTCGGPVEYTGCCPCEPPLFDDPNGSACADGGRDADGDGGLAAFCTGSTPRMIVNGTTAAPTVKGQPLALDCCDAGRIVVTTPDFSQPIAVEWRAQPPGVGQSPISIDLASPPTKWSIALLAGCSVTAACSGPLDNFRSGFAGWLTVDRPDGSFGFETGVCMRFIEPAGMPGTYVHTLDLYVPRVLTN